MPLHLQEATYADMPAIIDCIYDVYSHPYHPYIDIVFPGAGTNAPNGHARQAVVERQVQGWRDSPHTRWVMAFDSETDSENESEGEGRKVVGVSEWELYPENPFAAGPPRAEATWWPEGSLMREYLTFLMNDRLERQAERCSKAHIWLATMGVRPTHRRRGAASLMMQWGVSRADEMDLDMFVEASWYGSQVYRRFGFEYVDEFKLKRPKRREGDGEWDELERRHPFEGEWLERRKEKGRGKGKSEG